MKLIHSTDLDNDVFVGDYIDEDLKIFLRSGDTMVDRIIYYTHDEEPFCNYMRVEKGNCLIPFDDVEKIEVLD